MGSMVIRNIPDDVLTRLKEKARTEGKSAEQLAREALAEKANPSREQIIREIDAIRASSKPVSGQAIIDEIRRDRDSDLGKGFVEQIDDHRCERREPLVRADRIQRSRQRVSDKRTSWSRLAFS